MSATVGELLRDARARLGDAGVETPARDARLLLAAALDVDVSALIGADREPVAAGARERFAAMLSQREGRMPVSRILGRSEFWSLPLRVGPATLDPRPETETLVQAALDRLPDRADGHRVLDLGTGTGCLLLALLSELPNAWGVGTDASAEAAATAAGNARDLGLAGGAAFAVMDWADALAGRFDVIVSNPPYVRADELAGLAPEVAGHDPRAALVGGGDGLTAYRRVLPAIARLLAPGGVAAVEVGRGQADSVRGLAERAGLRAGAPVADLAGIARCVPLGAGV
ncbi:release factor glutamine methyltransferase [Limimonas halophila]|uniref:Release factor glutamine methyltransferase n=1 Tax=Limimonas halophila TaxID=1082479 RepID=A0A1G7Q010_9PROT|nr:peptide chain release factor N(5)-glutamine methyltransferase [Limimonas halophila]SDF91269.1 release factor glutamine methyltransferase [Limimonas halophila]